MTKMECGLLGYSFEFSLQFLHVDLTLNGMFRVINSGIIRWDYISSHRRLLTIYLRFMNLFQLIDHICIPQKMETPIDSFVKNIALLQCVFENVGLLCVLILSEKLRFLPFYQT